MQLAEHRARIINLLRQSARPLDDDELARRTGIDSRQTVNKICRGLEQAGVLRRFLGSDHKIVNDLISPQAGAMEPGSPAGMTVSQDAGHTAPPGSSSEQRDAERIVLDLLGQDLGLSLEPARIALPSGARIEVDGTDAGRTVLVECWAHRGPRNQRSATKSSPTPSS